MEMNYEDLQQLVEDSVERVMKRNGYAHKCHLEAEGYSVYDHKKHHDVLHTFMGNWRKIRNSFIAGILVALAGGAGVIVWASVVERIINGG